MPEPPGGIAVPKSVRDNLGITFAEAQRRVVSETRRVPGSFELLPTAKQEYRAPLAGRAKLLVEQFDAVEEGQILATIDSPAWRQLQHEAVEAAGEITMAEAALAVARARRQEQRTSLAQAEERLENLRAVEVRSAPLESEAAVLRSSVPRVDAEVRAQETALEEAHEHFASRMNAVSSVTGLTREELESVHDGTPLWRSMGRLPLYAQHAGVVEELIATEGGWLEAGELAMTVIDPARIRFHAEAPQSDVALFRDGLPARVVPPSGGSVAISSELHGTLRLGLTAHAEDRTISLYITPDDTAPWAKPGVGGFLEVALREDAPEQLAVPSAALIQDGLDTIFFRRDPDHPDTVRRTVADTGVTDGRWTVLRSGVMAGDEVVLDGVYALKLSASDGNLQAPPGYHYHADGTLHSDH